MKRFNIFEVNHTNLNIYKMHSLRFQCNFNYMHFHYIKCIKIYPFKYALSSVFQEYIYAHFVLTYMYEHLLPYAWDQHLHNIKIWIQYAYKNWEIFTFKSLVCLTWDTLYFQGETLEANLLKNLENAVRSILRRTSSNVL